MKPENKEFLAQMEPFYHKLKLGGTIHMHLPEQRRMLEIIREEWDPKFTMTPSCNECVYDLLKMAYNNYFAELRNEPSSTPQIISAPKPKKHAPQRTDKK
jgi:hypothetical protein